VQFLSRLGQTAVANDGFKGTHRIQ